MAHHAPSLIEKRLMPNPVAILYEHPGVEYMVSEDDGLPYMHDVNALSNFVADAPSVVGFDLSLQPTVASST
jgi:hypothetical protein